MMKQLSISLFLVLVATNLLGQTATSIANGSWLNPFNWSCTCVPTPGYTVIINHAITLDTDFGYTSGSIIINAAGSLIQDATPRSMSIGGLFKNSGTADFFALLISADTFFNQSGAVLNLSGFANYSVLVNTGTITTDSFYNDKFIENKLMGTLNVNGFLSAGTINNNFTINVDSFYNSGVINNYGLLDVSSFYNAGQLHNYKDVNQISAPSGRVDSIYNNGLMKNYAAGVIKVDSITNGLVGTLENNKLLSFADFTNLGYCYNGLEMNGSKSFWNNGFFENASSATMSIAVSFYNGDTTTAMQTAHYKNDGLVTIGDSWYNTDTISGASTGSFTVQDSSSTTGYLMGSFDFCDATPPPTSPFIDFNLGYVDPNITYCSMVGTTLLNTENKTLQIYPNPVTNELTILNNNQEILQLQLLNGLGQVVLQQQVHLSSETLSVSALNAGIYWLSITTKDGNLIQIEKVVKQ